MCKKEYQNVLSLGNCEILIDSHPVSHESTCAADMILSRFYSGRDYENIKTFRISEISFFIKYYEINNGTRFNKNMIYILFSQSSTEKIKHFGMV